uniref:Protein Asterix n=1 Tax=Strombidium rassoulzadegani TaxID=1082188 RepID=A0A7S3FYF3_9SPIT|mmetsp:Transcript_2117/g.3734  ORF Transcript_2117/g.3734 Transcript_2117/m.3734 type:complete len:102 (+) Transcript_2117:208-513(+)|eukprot:CAMPEP_0168617438 /NCGR_PEP_ID=MMETSP0449_2-20121227/5541_1 /TAXON_ID=1082188 /ORGANISM="Strombidium rassoulzadegani, Strain ras09" /LENGTH=101 /DNA_ID=CAMNT_0008658251 /DNA_START=173 /DNA_END=475 /DNA_ORIENTATION=+
MEPNENDEAGFGELYQLMAMVAGAICFFYKTKWSAWLCLFLFFTSIINFRFEHMMQQGMTSFTLVTVAFTQAYLAPSQQQLYEQKRRMELKNNPEMGLQAK